LFFVFVNMHIEDNMGSKTCKTLLHTTYDHVKLAFIENALTQKIVDRQ